MLQPHIQLDESVLAHCALLPGDPARLDRIAPFLSDVTELAYNREFRSLRGTYKGLPVLAVSTGIGGASAGNCRGRAAQHRRQGYDPHRQLRCSAPR